MVPRAKLGSDNPPAANPEISESSGRPRFSAAATPSARPTASAITVASTASRTVYPNAVPTVWLTGRLVLNDRPRSTRRARPSHSR